MLGNAGMALSDEGHPFISPLPRKDILHQSPETQVERGDDLL